MSPFPPTKQGVTSRHRLRGHDYAEPGFYFVTICINDGTNRLGAVIDHDFHPNSAGEMIACLWQQAPQRFKGVVIDEWCVMPNHFHGIVGIGVGEDDQPPNPSLPNIMDWFKSITTVEYIRGVKTLSWPRFQKRLWLDGYHDHIVRNDKDLDRIRDYIAANPSSWNQDRLYSPE